jgi:hypothetical protein
LNIFVDLKRKVNKIKKLISKQKFDTNSNSDENRETAPLKGSIKNGVSRCKIEYFNGRASLFVVASAENISLNKIT